MENISRPFSQDVVFAILLVAPLLAIGVAVRSFILRRIERPLPWMVAVVEIFAVGYTLCVVVVTLTPTGLRSEYPRTVDWRLAATDFGDSYERLQFVANCSLFIPLLLALVLVARPRRPLRFGLTCSIALPTAIELIQYAVTPGRIASVEDCLTGALGGVVGCVLAVACRRVGPFNTFTHGEIGRVTSAGRSGCDLELGDRAELTIVLVSDEYSVHPRAAHQVQRVAPPGSVVPSAVADRMSIR